MEQQVIDYFSRKNIIIPCSSPGAQTFYSSWKLWSYNLLAYVSMF